MEQHIRAVVGASDQAVLECRSLQWFCRCFVTKSEYTEDEDFTKADAVYDCIGDEGDERFSYSDMIKKSLQGATA